MVRPSSSSTPGRRAAPANLLRRNQVVSTGGRPRSASEESSRDEMGSSIVRKTAEAGAASATPEAGMDDIDGVAYRQGLVPASVNGFSILWLFTAHRHRHACLRVGGPGAFDGRLQHAGEVRGLPDGGVLPAARPGRSPGRRRALRCRGPGQGARVGGQRTEGVAVRRAVPHTPDRGRLRRTRRGPAARTVAVGSRQGVRTGCLSGAHRWHPWHQRADHPAGLRLLSPQDHVPATIPELDGSSPQGTGPSPSCSPSS